MKHQVKKRAQPYSDRARAVRPPPQAEVPHGDGDRHRHPGSSPSVPGALSLLVFLHQLFDLPLPLDLPLFLLHSPTSTAFT